MKRSLKEILAQSHVASVAIAVLLFWFINNIFLAVWTLIVPALSFLATAIAILGIPFVSWSYTRYTVFLASFCLCSAIIDFLAAWLVSRWIYDAGPIRSLILCCDKLIGRNHV